MAPPCASTEPPDRVAAAAITATRSILDPTGLLLLRVHAPTRELRRSVGATSFPWVGSRPTQPATCELVETDRQEQHQANGDELPEGVDAHDDHRVLDERHEQHAQEGTRDAALSARQAGASEDHGGDDLELDAVPGQHHRGVEARCEERTRQPREQAHDHERHEDRPVHVDARQLGCARVAADVVGLSEVAGLAHQEREQDHDDGHEPERGVDAHDLGLAEHGVAIADVGDAGARHELQEAAVDGHRGEGRDERVDLEAGDDDPVHDAQQRAPRTPGEEGHEGRHAQVLGHQTRHDARERQDAADREVEHAADEQQHHAAREDAGLSRVLEYHRGVVERQEGGGPQDAHDQQERPDQRDEQQRAVEGDPGQQPRGPRAAGRMPAPGRRWPARYPRAHRSAGSRSCGPLERGVRLRCGHVEDGDLGGDGSVHLTGDPATRHHDHPMGEREHLGEVGRDHHQGDASRRELAQDGVDVRLGPDVHAPCRLIHDEHPRVAEQPLGEQHLLLVATRQRAHLAVDIRRGDPQLLDVSRGLPLHGRLGQEAAPREARQVRRRDVRGDVEVDEQAGLLAVLGDHRDARGHGVLGRVRAMLATIDEDRAVAGWGALRRWPRTPRCDLRPRGPRDTRSRPRGPRTRHRPPGGRTARARRGRPGRREQVGADRAPMTGPDRPSGR